MSLEQEQVYSDVQSLFCRGLVIIVGSGASSAQGLPGMGDLAEHLLQNVPKQISIRSLACLPDWVPIAKLLEEGKGLEEALAAGVTDPELADLIAEQIAACISEKELDAVTNLLESSENPVFSRLFLHMIKTSSTVDVITTNYDRLLEVQAARVGIAVNSMFCGQTVGKFDPDQCDRDMLRPDNQVGKRRNPTVYKVPHIRLSKPHGSLDWFTFGNGHFRSDLAVKGARRIVAPGGNKYRQGYDVPFDQQRERANSAIDRASALLFVGYGFNDDHLQTHINEKISQVPSVVVSHTLTDSARSYLANNHLCLGIESRGATDEHASAVKGGQVAVIERPIWDLDQLLKEVLSV